MTFSSIMMHASKDLDHSSVVIELRFGLNLGVFQLRRLPRDFSISINFKVIEQMDLLRFEFLTNHDSPLFFLLVFSSFYILVSD